ncbi:Dyp-type peroxidase [Nocardioides salsibiostraticola]
MTRAVAGNTSGQSEGSALALDNIQGNILGGFNKDHQRLLFFRLGAGAPACQWLADLVDEVATSEEVMSFNRLFKRARARRGGEDDTPTSRWLNVAFTYEGFAALNVKERDLARFPSDFRQGMAARAAHIGDVDQNAPDSWVGPFASRRLHGVLLLAADNPAELEDLTTRQRRRMTAAGIEVLFNQNGLVRQDLRGHEHFGFRDGISQPGIRGFTQPQNPDNPDQGMPGQDLLWPGEFVLGHPTQIATEHPDHPGGVNPDPGPDAHNGPMWTADGSYLVFRRLHQDVEGFRSFISETARTQGLSDEQLGAKIVGRYPSGAPLEHTEDQPARLDTTAGDPSVDDPSLLDDDRINDFEFGEDIDGGVVPLAAHIRKTYPRDDATPTGGESDTQTRRLLRRGIPFGLSYDESAPSTSPSGATPAFPHDRGLLFLAYQTSIERQFEFVQRDWVNNPDAPGTDAGHDLVIGQADSTRTMSLPGGKPDHITMLERYVTTTGGAYLFQPSISALRQLSRHVPTERRKQRRG